LAIKVECRSRTIRWCRSFRAVIAYLNPEDLIVCENIPECLGWSSAA
jgi:hypothetical protein